MCEDASYPAQDSGQAIDHFAHMVDIEDSKSTFLHEEFVFGTVSGCMWPAQSDMGAVGDAGAPSTTGY
jgi:hypothetical protein